MIQKCKGITEETQLCETIGLALDWGKDALPTMIQGKHRCWGSDAGELQDLVRSWGSSWPVLSELYSIFSNPILEYSLEAAQGAPRAPRRDSRGERSPWLPLEPRPDSPGEPGMQPRDPCLPWSPNQVCYFLDRRLLEFQVRGQDGHSEVWRWPGAPGEAGLSLGVAVVL